MGNYTMNNEFDITALTQKKADNAAINLANICEQLLDNITVEGDTTKSNSQVMLQRSAQSYVHSFLGLCGTVGSMGSKIKGDLLSAYVPMSFRLHQSVRMFDSIEAMELAFVRDQQRRNYAKYRNDLKGIELANEEQHLMILGEAGTGKSTFLKFIGMEALLHERGQYLPNCIPVYLDLRAFYHRSEDLVHVISKIFASHGFPLSSQLVEAGLKAGQFLFLMDDLHVVPEDQKTFLQQLINFTEKYANNRFIVCTRSASYRQSWGLFLEVVVEPWTSLYVQEFIYKWHLAKANVDFNHEPERIETWASEKAQQCWELVQHNLYPHYLHKTAIGCSALCLAFHLHFPLPHHPASLYQTIWRSLIDHYILQWQREYKSPSVSSLSPLGKDDSKPLDQRDNIPLSQLSRDLSQGISGQGNSNQINSNQISSNQISSNQINLSDYGVMSPALMEIALGAMSYAIFEQGESFFSLKQAQQQIEQFLAARISATVSNLYAKMTVGFAKKKDLWCKSGEYWCFAQPMLHEFFVARYVLSTGNIDRLVKLHLRDRRWHNIFLSMAALMPDLADPLLLSIERQTAIYLQSRKLQLILEWSNRLAHSADSAYTQTMKRIATIFLIRTHDIDLGSALTLCRAHLLAADLLKDLGLNLNLDEPFGIQLSLILARILEFDSSTELQLTQNLAAAFERTLKSLGFGNDTVPFDFLKEQLAALGMTVPNYAESYEVRHNFSQQVSYVWFDTLGIDRNLMTLTITEVQALEDYFYAHLLLRKCAHRAVAVSHRTMANIESRVFSDYRSY